MATNELLCPKCNSEKVIFAGYNYCKSGKKQRLKCQACGNYFQHHYSLASCKPGVKAQIMEMLHNGSGIRDISRVLKVGKETISKEVKKNVFSEVYK
jgi:transposase-like protein